MKNVVILLLLAFCISGYGQIINFPDANFKKALVNGLCVDTNGNGTGDADADLNDDGEIDINEALKVKQFRLGARNIDSLNGIENFKNLEVLYCTGNNLKQLNLDGLNKLKILNCSYNDIKLLNVENAKSLTSISCAYNSLTYLDVKTLNSLKNLVCPFNELNVLDLQNMQSLNKLYCNDNKLKSLQVNGCNKLNLIHCYGNRIDSLIAQNLPELDTLLCAYNIMTYLNVNGSFSLTYLECNANNLKELHIKTGRANNWTRLFLKYNTNLKYTCCNFSDILLVKSQVPENCEVNSYCSFTPGGKFYIIKGENKYDAETNGCDEQDTKLPHFKYNITNGSISGSVISNYTGNYSIPVQEGTHTLTPILENPNHFEVTPSSITVTFPSISDTITQDFCIIPKGIFHQTNITVIPLSPPARPGFDAKYKIVWENVGNQIESGTLNFTYDETLLDYISATQAEDLKSDGIVSWYFNNLLPFEKREITVTLKVNRPTDTPAVNAGDKLYLAASILDNIFTFENTLVGSYDPNDKTCLQGDRVKPDMVGEYVDYLIRFENTGNYAAENVVVKDIIDTKRFDVSTLQITDASHEVYTRIEGNKVEFIFEKIQLPFDDANNDGYIAFKIKTLSTLVLGDSLKNMADIYFDYNFPIRTNEAKTTIALSVHTADITTAISIYPNPVTDILYLQTDEIWTKAEIYDISGRIMRVVSLDSQSIDVSILERGTYFIRLRNGNKIGRVKFVKI